MNESTVNLHGFVLGDAQDTFATTLIVPCATLYDFIVTK
jgi:hypothetical protein